MTPGTKFMVSEPLTVKNDKGMILAKYLPDFEYTITARNQPNVVAWINAGKATAGGIIDGRRASRAGELKAPASKVKGSVSTGKAKEKK